MSDLTLLWVDLTLRKSHIPTTQHFEDLFNIRRNSPDSPIGSDGADRPVALCFDYDFPDQSGLRLLEETKRLHPSIPILMLTVQHSEELAVWSFRARVWDYFVKPVRRHDVERCYESLRRIDATTSTRQSVRTNPPLPAENSLRRSGPIDERVLGPAVAYVQSHYSEKINQTEMARLCGINTFRFSRMFSQVFGQTFQEFLIRYRIERAEELLLNPALSISDIGHAVGFRDASYFGRIFRRTHYLSPTQWRQQQLSKKRPSPEIERAGSALPISSVVERRLALDVDGS